MTTNSSRRALVLGLGATLLGTAACGLPRSGPNKKEIYAGSVLNGGDAFVVTVNDHVVRATAVQPALGFPASFSKVGKLGSDTINPGDTLTISIWENVEDGVMGKKGIPTPLANVQVDGDGYIFIPYAGRVKASGRSPDQLRQLLTQKLDAQTPDPQITIDRTPGDGSTVSIMGTISGQGVYAIERPTRTLSSMIARAGGVSIKPENARITLTRAGKSASIWLKDLYDNPNMDIALRAGDVILVEQDTRAFTALGATGAQARMPFESPTLSALEAIATVGGLQTSLADPTGVFVFRNEPAAIAKRVLGRSDLVGDQRIVYVLNLTQPNGMFLARDFVIRDGDTVYVTEAPYVQWQKSLAVLTGSASSANAISNIGQGG